MLRSISSGRREATCSSVRTREERRFIFSRAEFNREANTIGSKGNDLEQARTVVEIKAELEKIREQTQNIE